MNLHHKLASVPAIAQSLNPKNAIAVIRHNREIRRIDKINAKTDAAIARARERYQALRALGTFKDMSEEQIDRILDDLMDYEIKVTHNYG